MLQKHVIIIYMDIDKLKRRQNLKVIFSESLMVAAVVLIVAALALVVSGYWVNSDLKVERQGMLQISSVPSGANLEIDGETSWLQRTNTSKILSSGQHTVSLTKDGYDSWSRTINISEGLLYRILYPRLFLENRESSSVLDASTYTAASVSPDRNMMLLLNDTTSWSLVQLENEQLKPETIDISRYFNSVSLASDADKGLFTGHIINYDWDADSNHILFEVEGDSGTEWVLLDIDNPKNSVNLTNKYSAKFDEVEILDNSSHNLLALEDGNLRKISVSDEHMSSVLAPNVIDFDHYDNEIIFATDDKKADDDKYTLGLLKLSDPSAKDLKPLDGPAKVALFKFYEDKYIVTLVKNQLTLYNKEDFSEKSSYEISFKPKDIKIGASGEFITVFDGNHLASLDLEASVVTEWETDGPSFSWLDGSMIYSIKDGWLTVYDFDGQNRRELSFNVSSHFPVTITNDKWLYYFSDGKLIREVIN